MSYGDVSRAAAAEAMQVSTGQFDRFISATDKRYTPSWQQLWDLADTANIPRDFFSADLALLHQIVPAGAPRFEAPARGATPPRGALAQRLGVDQTNPESRPEPHSDQDTGSAEGAGQ